jgi:hypothetical protein
MTHFSDGITLGDWDDVTGSRVIGTRSGQPVIFPNDVAARLDMRSFGVKGDGSDETSKVQACIAAAEAMTPPGTILLPEAIVEVTGITVSKAINFVGKGKLKSILKLRAGSNTSLITFTGEITGPSFLNKQPQMLFMGLDGNKANQSGTSHGVFFPDVAFSAQTDYSFSCSMFEVDIRDCLTNGIRIGNNRNAGNFTRGSVKDSGSSGIHIGSANDWHFNHFGSGGNGAHGIYNVGGQMIRIFDPDIYSNTLSGIRMDSTADDINIIGGSIDRNSQHGFLINGNTGSPVDKLFTLLGVKFFQNSAETTNTYSDITLNDCYGGATIGCMFKRSTVNSPKHLVRFSGTSGRHRFIGNMWNETNAPYATSLTDNPFELLQDRNSRLLDFAVGIAAAGADQAGATALTAEINRVSGGGANGVRLPTATYHGQRIHVTATTGSTITVYPATGQQINGGGANVGVAVSNGNGREFIWESGTPSWWTFVR